MTTDHALVRLSSTGERVVMEKPLRGRWAQHRDLGAFVDERTGRWVLPRQDGNEPWTIVFGDANGAVAEVPANADCLPDATCYVVVQYIDGDDVFVSSMTHKGTNLSRYQFGRPGRIVLAGPTVATDSLLAPKQRQLAYAIKDGIAIVPWSRNGVPRGAKRKVIKTSGKATPLAIADGSIYYRLERKDPATGATSKVVEAYDLKSGRRSEVYQPAGAINITTFSTNARGTTLVRDSLRDGDNNNRLVELGRGTARVVTDVSQLFDVSEDGRFVVVRYGPPWSIREKRATAWPDLRILDLETGAVVAEWHEKSGPSVSAVQFTY